METEDKPGPKSQTAATVQKPGRPRKTHLLRNEAELEANRKTWQYLQPCRGFTGVPCVITETKCFLLLRRSCVFILFLKFRTASSILKYTEVVMQISTCNIQLSQRLTSCHSGFRNFFFKEEDATDVAVCQLPLREALSLTLLSILDMCRDHMVFSDSLVSVSPSCSTESWQRKRVLTVGGDPRVVTKATTPGE